MLFKNVYLRSFRLFLFPLALVYGGFVMLRNYLYHKKIIGSIAFNIPIIGVGNLSIGGTGKSPMVDYIAGLLKHRYKTATLSRGYRRRTSGYVLANTNSSSIEIGDEPMQFHLAHPEIAVAVGEKRIEAVPQLLYDRPDTKVIILDDAFQHREIVAGLDIVLTEFANLYTRDFFLPTGDLRDQRESAHRAHVVVVTKCPADLTHEAALAIKNELGLQPHQYLFFTTIEYGTPYHIITKERRALSKSEEILLICGIANPMPLTQYIHESTKTYDALFYRDHHIYTIDDINEMEERFNLIQSKEKMYLTTDKDAVRLIKFKDRINDHPFFVLPISLSFLFNQQALFDQLILDYPQKFYAEQLAQDKSM
ncbi:MAG: tetraacyldisaccharide 4'-kinase [Bacteroidota bacterium]